MHARRDVEVTSRSHPQVDATYLAVGPDELRRGAAEGDDDRALFELATGTASGRRRPRSTPSGAAVAARGCGSAASPGRCVWDLAMAARMWIPLRPRPEEDPGDAPARARRLGHLVAGYGLERADHEEFVDAIIEAQQVGNEFVRRRVEAAEPGFVAMWNERGGAEWFDEVTAWMEGQRDLWLEALRA
jgi:hypothetical protein